MGFAGQLLAFPVFTNVFDGDYSDILMPHGDAHNSRFSAWRDGIWFFGNYRTRLLSTLALSLLCLNILLRLPLPSTMQAVGWQFNPHSNDTVLDLIDLPRKPAAEAADGPPATRHEVPISEGRINEPEQKTAEAESDPLPEPPQPEITKLDAKTLILEFSEKQPAIVGGVGAYYLKIEYPQAAIDAGIHGRLVLDFVVEPDGTASHIGVLQSLHPLCDSAAVRSLRQTRFVPGRQNGEEVRVRMRLPVRFQLIETETGDASDAR